MIDSILIYEDDQLDYLLQIFEIFDNINLIIENLEFDINNLIFNITKELETLQI